jgi:hypothetical protein
MGDIKRGFQCDATWHLRKHGALALAIYNKIAAITYDQLSNTYGVYFSSGRALAEFYGTSENHVTQVLRELKTAGWLEGIGNAAIYKSKNYHYVLHDEWAAKHPGKCYVRTPLAWDGEDHDELAQSLYKHSGGRTFWHEEMLTALRATGATDEEIVGEWVHRVMTLTEQPKGKKDWEKIVLTFVHDCKVGKILGKSSVTQ